MTDQEKVEQLLASWWNGESYDVDKEELKALVREARRDEVVECQDAWRDCVDDSDYIVWLHERLQQLQSGESDET